MCVAVFVGEKIGLFFIGSCVNGGRRKVLFLRAQSYSSVTIEDREILIKCYLGGGWNDGNGFNSLHVCRKMILLGVIIFILKD